MKVHENEQYIQGRGGLKIPTLNEREIWDNNDVLSFLRTLQTINGLDVSTSQGSRERRQARSFHNVLMIGKTSTKPLVVIQGSHEARARSDVEYDLRRNREREEWGQWPETTTGYVKHSIHVSPEDLKESTALLEVQDTLAEGGSGNFRGSRPWLYINGESRDSIDFLPQPNDYSEGNQQLGRVAYSDYLKQTLAEVVDLLK